VKNLLRISDLTSKELFDLVDLASLVRADPSRYEGSLKGRSIGLFFMKQSVRTWVSTDVAAMELGMHTVVIRNEDAGLGTRESPEDVGRVLERYLDILGMRVFSHNDLDRVAMAVTVPVINLLSDIEHPCQAIADLQTIADHFGRLEGIEVAYVGDGNNTATSLIGAVVRTGGKMRVASPPGYRIGTPEEEFGEVLFTNDPKEAVAQADVVYTDVWTSMGQEAETAERRRAFAGYQVNRELFDLAKPNAIFMHCLPAHRGEEATDDILDDPRSLIFDQAENRLHSFKAILLTALG
jgi:ornithine carbamoyltransferase